ncbi:ImmA/IrrE family metallo-endopeptidase [Actinotignum sp. GS-2025c]|uniref:ImmA/IrrE family metallo-endopeptidase n=1 Tax=Actinotignum sp. GS-2025c TaxID=3427276 RepID=UPI003F46FA05
MSAETDGSGAALRLREKFGLGTDPISDILELPKLLHVDVLCIAVGGDEHGLTARDEENDSFVFVVNSALPYARFRSTVAHEIGHFVFQEDLTSAKNHGYSGSSETRAHAFARHLLLPLSATETICAQQSGYPKKAWLNSLVRDYGVSSQIAAFQMSNAGLIGSKELSELRQYSTRKLAEEYGWISQCLAREASVSQSSQRPPVYLQEKAKEAFAQGKVTAEVVAEILGVDVSALGPPPSVVHHVPDISNDDISGLM